MTPAGDVVVVTGAATGLGRAVAGRCLAEGVGVVGVDLDPRILAATSDELGDRFVPVEGDVALRATHERAAEAAESVGTLSGWVNNAGIALMGRADEISDDDFERTIAVNLVGTAYGCAVAVQRFLDSGAPGAIVNVSSVEAVASFPRSFAYEASKGGIDALTRQVAVEYAKLGIRCNAVRPGSIDTSLTAETAASAADPEAEMAIYAEIQPIGRLAQPDEIAGVIAFLLGPDAGYVTGACVAVDGGASARCYPYPLDPALIRPGSGSA